MGEILSRNVVQGILAILIVAGLVYLYVTGRPVPDSLLALSGLVLGFYFRGVVEQLARRGRG